MSTWQLPQGWLQVSASPAFRFPAAYGGFGIKATGAGYQPYAAEGAVKGITIMATFSFTF